MSIVCFRKAALAAIVLVLAVSSHGWGLGAREKVGRVADERVPLKLAYFVGWSVPSLSRDTNPALKYIEDKLGIEMDLTVMMIDMYRQRLPVMIAGGDIPDAFAWEKMDSFVVDLIETGTVVPLDQLIDQYPNLRAQRHLYKSLYKGKTWAIPNVRNPIASGDIPMIRADWLAALNLAVPRTLDELYTVARAFSERDPDGNGRRDTYGIQLTNTAMGWGLAGAGGFEQAFGLSNNWVREGGTWVPKFATQRYREFLSWMNRAYRDGLIDPDFALTDTALAESKVTREGRAGIFIHFATRIYDFEANFQRANPNARLVGFEALKGPHGDRGIAARVNQGGVFISRRAADNPVKLRKIMEWLDFGASQEGGVFWTSGVEGIHHTRDASGAIVVNSEAFARDMPRTFSWSLPIQPVDQVFVFPQFSKEARAEVVRTHRLNEPHIKFNDTSFVFSPTNAKYDNESIAFIRDNLIKTIMGARTVAQWDDVVREWYRRFEGHRIAQEIAVAMGN